MKVRMVMIPPPASSSESGPFRLEIEVNKKERDGPSDNLYRKENMHTFNVYTAVFHFIVLLLMVTKKEKKPAVAYCRLVHTPLHVMRAFVIKFTTRHVSRKGRNRQRFNERVNWISESEVWDRERKVVRKISRHYLTRTWEGVVIDGE